MFLRRKGRYIILTLSAAVVAYLTISNFQVRSQKKSIEKALISLSVKYKRVLSDVVQLRADSLQSERQKNVLRQAFNRSEREKDSVEHVLGVTKKRLVKAAAKVKSFEEQTIALTTALNLARQKTADLNAELNAARQKTTDLKPFATDIASIRRAFAPRIALFASQINTADAEEVYKKIFPYLDKRLCDRQLNFVYSPEGKKLRGVSRALKCPDLERLYMFVISMGMDPKTAEFSHVQAAIRQSLYSNEFERIATEIFKCDASTVRRLIVVCKGIFNLEPKGVARWISR